MAGAGNGRNVREQLAQILQRVWPILEMFDIVVNLVNERNALRTENQRLRNDIASLRHQIRILSTASNARIVPEAFHDYDRYDSRSDGADGSQ